jgi:hypothetical protein
LVPVDLLSAFAVNDVEAALALSFTTNEYRTGNTATTFADAFTGTSPKLTYSTTSNSTMVNSAGNIVWAPHNLALNSATPATQTITVTSGADYTVRVTGTGSMALSGAGTGTATEGSPATITASTTSLTITLTGSLDTVAVYRSDLGGMAQVPGAATGFETYVPTNGNAEYLPRVGHHVYNGSAWVNEGLLIESEARTNLVTYSEDFTDASWVKVIGSVTADATTAPSGSLADKYVEDTSNSYHRVAFAAPVTSGNSYSLSVFAKYSGRQYLVMNAQALFNARSIFDIQAGTVASTPLGTATIDDMGNGWFRCSITATASSSHTSTQFYIGTNTSAADTAYLGDGTSGIYLWGAQLEAASTPSSYIPTNNSTVTRGGQSLTVPPAEFGWPEPEYIGPELVTDFSTYADQTAFDVDWTRGTGWTFSGGVASVNGGAAADNLVQYDIGVVDGSVYQVTFDVTSISANGRLYLLDPYFETSPITTTGVKILTVVSSASRGDNIYIRALSTDGNAMTASIDNISVREINPLSVSIQMDGRMTYADEDGANVVFPFQWKVDGNNFLDAYFDTTGADTGQLVVRQKEAGTHDEVTGPADAYSPGVLVPFNISSRHGSTFVNGAVDGVALTADTTPTALPDLSNTNLEIAEDFMGTIGQFRQFAGDIGDAGLVTATNPSTEPTLSLTFDGTEGSFYNLSWSE